MQFFYAVVSCCYLVKCCCFFCCQFVLMPLRRWFGKEWLPAANIFSCCWNVHVHPHYVFVAACVCVCVNHVQTKIDQPNWSGRQAKRRSLKIRLRLPACRVINFADFLTTCFVCSRYFFFLRLEMQFARLWIELVSHQQHHTTFFPHTKNIPFR